MSSRLLATALAASACLLSLTSTDADACMHGGELLPDTSPQEVLRAEHQVAKGQYDAAARNVVKSFPRIRKRRLHRSVLSDRALRVMAQVVVRTGGNFDLGAFLPGKTQAQRNANIEWSVHTLQGLSLKRPNDAVATGSLAEAFALVPAKREDARRMLSDLEHKDLLASPQGFATLATLREGTGRGKPAFLLHPLRTLQHARARVARARCEVMAEDAKLCARPQT